LTNGQENSLGTNPANPDSDGDGEPDGHLDEGTTDKDGDGLADALESEIIDADGDGFANETDPANSDPCIPNVLSSPCNPRLLVYPRVILQGAWKAADGMMHDQLRVKNLLPLANPYNSQNLYGHDGTEATTADVFTETGADAIVDWVLVELRSSANPAFVLEKRAALVQRDGDVVDTDGFSPVAFDESAGSYFIVVRHRNHLGVMSAQPVALGVNSPLVLDFTNPATQTWGNHSQVLQDGKTMLWAGNTNSNGELIYQGNANDIDPIFFNVVLAGGNGSFATNFIHAGYHNADTNLDGDAIFQGATNDLDAFLFFNVLLHPANSLTLITYIVEEQLP
ncbi:MAG: hypothetical protein AAB316_06860, partial [Bacteroidota bacterium]